MTRVDESPRSLRGSATLRGVVIGALIAGYSWLFRQPHTSFAAGLLVGAALQLAVLMVRRWVPADEQPRLIDVCEMLADGATVLLFALGIYGGLARMPADV
jgi:hypothetical protein